MSMAHPMPQILLHLQTMYHQHYYPHQTTLIRWGNIVNGTLYEIEERSVAWDDER